MCQTARFLLWSVILEHLLQTHNSAEQSCERFLVFFFNFVQNNVGGEISNNYYPWSNGAPFAFVLESARSQCVQPLKRFFCCNCDAFQNLFRKTRPKLLFFLS